MNCSRDESCDQKGEREWETTQCRVIKVDVSLITLHWWFAVGLHEKGCKQSAAQMRVSLFDKDAGEYDIPM